MENLIPVYTDANRQTIRHRHIIASTIVIMAALSTSGSPEIHVAPGKYNDYYHLRFVLKPDNFELTVPLSERLPPYSDSNDYSFSEGGQFEVFIRKSAFLIPAPHTDREFLILRMPWTNPFQPQNESFIVTKRNLFDRIRDMKIQNTGSVEVTIQLNPYVTLLNEQPLALELTGRNIFFRQAYGQYIDYVGPLREADIAKQD